jgi:hypothetical protein
MNLLPVDNQWIPIHLARLFPRVHNWHSDGSNLPADVEKARLIPRAAGGRRLRRGLSRLVNKG